MEDLGIKIKSERVREVREKSWAEDKDSGHVKQVDGAEKRVLSSVSGNVVFPFMVFGKTLKL